MSQVVFPSDVGDLFGLHGLQLWTVGDTMTQTTAKCAASLSCGCSKKKKWAKRKKKEKATGKNGDEKPFFLWNDSPPMSSMVSSPLWSTWSTGGTFCLASTSRALRSISTDSSARGRGHASFNLNFKINVWSSCKNQDSVWESASSCAQKPAWVQMQTCSCTLWYACGFCISFTFPYRSLYWWTSWQYQSCPIVQFFQSCGLEEEKKEF